MLALCNDPKCGLNRQGVPHEDHETIQSKEIKNPCLDGRCAMNRIGILSIRKCIVNHEKLSLHLIRTVNPENS